MMSFAILVWMGAGLLVMGALGAYFAAEKRGLVQVLISTVTCIPLSVILSYLYMLIQCNYVNDYYCGLSFFISLPISITIGFFVLAFLPNDLFKLLSGFSSGAGIALILLLLFYFPTLSTILTPDFWWIFICVCGISGAYISNKVIPAEKAKNVQKTRAYKQ